MGSHAVTVPLRVVNDLVGPMRMWPEKKIELNQNSINFK
jgi:hypothetical protein